MGLLPLPSAYPFLFLLLFAAPLREAPASTALWAAPAILVASLMIAWAAEASQFFIAQGFALAILAWLQTLPEFAVEAVWAWHQQVPLLMANLTGALRLLTGLGWPMIYFTAAMFQRRRGAPPLKAIHLAQHHAVEVVGLMVPLLYIGYIAFKNSLTIFDAIPLVVIYAAYLLLLSKLPAEDPETIDDLEAVPRKIVLSPRAARITIIAALFAAGGVLIYVAAEPFAASLLALATLVGIPTFVFVQWVAPLVSEFPEMASTFYWARTVHRAPMALMNMVSSNINQWTLLAAMLPIVLSISAGTATPIEFDAQQRLEVLMTLGQALVGMMFLLNMELAWWEAAVLFVLFLIPFASSATAPYVTGAYYAWTAIELVRMLLGRRKPQALIQFAKVWKTHIRV
jgi:cation:H+ antiporter